jgi:hypothetical protein
LQLPAVVVQRQFAEFRPAAGGVLPADLVELLDPRRFVPGPGSPLTRT